MVDNQQDNKVLGLSDHLNIETNSANLSPDIQRYFTDPSPMLLYFYSAWCGWVISYESKKNKLFGIEKEKTFQFIAIDKRNRIIDEAGASHAYHAVNPLISSLIQSSNLTERQIFNLWRPTLKILSFDLLDSYYLEGNPYDIKAGKIPVIMTTLGQLYGVTCKAKNGFQLKQMTETFITSNIIKNGGDLGQLRKEGTIDKIKSALTPKLS